MRIALFANMKKQASFEIAKEVAAFLQKKHISVVARDDVALALSLPLLSSIPSDSIDFLISLGGDGTILRLVHHFPHLQAPILGVNLGHLGFMADVPVSNLYPSLEALLKGDFRIEERVMMEGFVINNEPVFAVNEIVIHRSHNPSLIDLSITVDGNYLNTFSADGIIVATPNGSTAYSLAAGGPILTPELDAFVITPISPHTISNRPIVLMPKESIQVQYLSRYHSVEVIYDGFPRHTLTPHDILSISRSKRKFQMVTLFSTDYFSTLRTKLGWSGQVRYNDLSLIADDSDN